MTAKSYLISAKACIIVGYPFHCRLFATPLAHTSNLQKMQERFFPGHRVEAYLIQTSDHARRMLGVQEDRCGLYLVTLAERGGVTPWEGERWLFVKTGYRRHQKQDR